MDLSNLSMDTLLVPRVAIMFWSFSCTGSSISSFGELPPWRCSHLWQRYQSQALPQQHPLQACCKSGCLLGGNWTGYPFPDDHLESFIVTNSMLCGSIKSSTSTSYAKQYSFDGKCSVYRPFLGDIALVSRAQSWQCF